MTAEHGFIAGRALVAVDDRRAVVKCPDLRVMRGLVPADSVLLDRAGGDRKAGDRQQTARYSPRSRAQRAPR